MKKYYYRLSISGHCDEYLADLDRVHDSIGYVLYRAGEDKKVYTVQRVEYTMENEIGGQYARCSATGTTGGTFSPAVHDEWDTMCLDSLLENLDED